jgi:2-oxoglutarate dehydrogenase E2 component (dihydrolipoamide succinyltransferase)
MSIEVRVPQLPESVADAVLAKWHKKVGEVVNRDENLVDLETDKVMLEVPAPATGVLREIKFQDGATVTSGQILAIVEAGATATAAPAAAPATPAATEPVATKQGDKSADKSGPAARRIMEENKVNPTEVAATGKDGRVTKGDVIQHLAKPAADKAASKSAAPAAPLAAKGARSEQRVAMTRLRARIAERLIHAQSTAAMLTTFNEVDLTAVNEIRARYKDKFEKAHGVKLGFSSFFIKAAIEGLRKFPSVNASIDGNDIVYHEFYDMGVAVSTDRGLMVPVLRNAENLSFAEIEAAVGAYAKRAREGSITLEELTGGTFTITNGGVFGSLLSTPILNTPQVAILGMHKIQERPVVVEGQIVIRPMMYLALTYDHRIVDGRESVQFLVAIKEALEDPARLLLQL